MEQDLTYAPQTAPRYFLWGSDFDFEIARNVLLHYINEKGLNEDCLKWLKERFPEEDR